MSFKDQALRAAVLKAVSDALAAQVDAERDELFGGLVSLHDLTGAKSLDVSLPDGRKVASISLSMPKAGAKIVDSEEFDAYIAKRFPAAVVEVPARVQVPDTFRKQLLGELDFSQGFGIDSNGEVVPGVAWAEAGAPKSFSIRFEKLGREQIAAAWSDGLFGDSLPGMAPQALPAPEAAR